MRLFKSKSSLQKDLTSYRLKSTDSAVWDCWLAFISADWDDEVAFSSVCNAIDRYDPTQMPYEEMQYDQQSEGAFEIISDMITVHYGGRSHECLLDEFRHELRTFLKQR